MALFDRLHTSSYSSSIVTMAVSFTLFEYRPEARYWSKTPIIHTPFRKSIIGYACWVGEMSDQQTPTTNKIFREKSAIKPMHSTTRSRWTKNRRKRSSVITLECLMHTTQISSARNYTVSQKLHTFCF